MNREASKPTYYDGSGTIKNILTSKKNKNYVIKPNVPKVKLVKFPYFEYQTTSK